MPRFDRTTISRCFTRPCLPFGPSWTSVWSPDIAAARKVAVRTEACTVCINNRGALDPRVPFGGAKQSGYGAELGVEGLW